MILFMIAIVIWSRGEWHIAERLPLRNLVFPALSGAATGLSWLCYYHALQLAPAARGVPIRVCYTKPKPSLLHHAL